MKKAPSREIDYACTIAGLAGYTSGRGLAKKLYAKIRDEKIQDDV